mmetsp:Transcript_7932/g.12735  ORF Transcript_7932/g.12735 Transcript_7932/m.12735 type:complete len:267 (-) Transcript_7932:97-897(-)
MMRATRGLTGWGWFGDSRKPEGSKLRDKLSEYINHVPLFNSEIRLLPSSSCPVLIPGLIVAFISLCFIILDAPSSSNVSQRYFASKHRHSPFIRSNTALSSATRPARPNIIAIFSSRKGADDTAARLKSENLFPGHKNTPCAGGNFGKHHQIYGLVDSHPPTRRQVAHTPDDVLVHGQPQVMAKEDLNAAYTTKQEATGSGVVEEEKEDDHNHHHHHHHSVFLKTSHPHHPFFRTTKPHVHQQQGSESNRPPPPPPPPPPAASAAL